MFKPRISTMEVQRLLREGYNQSQVAEKLGCSKQNISKMIKQGRVSPPQVEIAGGYGHIDGMSQWNDINRIIRSEIERLNEKIKETDDKIDFAEITEDEKELKHLFSLRKSLQNERMQCIKEARQQIDLLKDILKELLAIETFQSLKKRVLAILFEEIKDHEQRQRILNRIGDRISTRHPS